MAAPRRERSPTLPAHVEETVSAIVQVHADHYNRAGPFQRIVTANTAALARPVALVAAAVGVLAWMALNTVVAAVGLVPPDPPPYSGLSTVASVLALLTTLMILITQRHDDELASHRDQLTLELAILSERKSSKIIELLEAARARDPDRHHHRDAEAEELANAADPQAVLEAIRANHADLGATIPTELL